MDHNPYSVGEQQTNGDADFQGLKLGASVRTMQIIAVALIMGVLTFLLVVLLVTKGDIGGMQNAGLMTMIAAGFGFLMIVNHFVIPPIVTGTQLKQAAAEFSQQQEQVRGQQLYGIYQTQLIIGMALLEGAAFFNLIAMMLEKSVASLGVVILLLCLMLVKFPTHTKVSWWVQDNLREME